MSAELGLLVIGGGPAGLSAVRAYRDAGAEAAVVLVTDEQRMPYRRPPLTKDLLQGAIDETQLPLEQESWLAEQRVALIGGRAVAIDPDARQVTLAGGRTLDYEHCLLATGSEPTRLPVPGADDPAVRVVRTLDDVRELLARLRWGGEVVVIGSGFIGCEIAASLRRRGHPVELVSDETAPNSRRLGERAAAEIAGWLEREGVGLHLGAEVEAIERHGHRLRVTAGEDVLSAPVVVMAAGVAPRSDLLAAHGAPLHEGAVVVDGAMRSELPGILACGDVCFAHNEKAGRRLHVEHWGDALGQGAVAGRTAGGVTAAWEDVPGFWSTIGGRTLKYAAWGDGHDAVRFEPAGDDGAFTAWYGKDGRIVGVLAHECDESYERGQNLIAEGAAWS